MTTADSVKAKIQGLIDKANEATGESDTDLTAAVDRLIEGYGSDVRISYADVDTSVNPLTAKIQHMIDTINSVTGKSDSTLTAAINSLIGEGGSETDILYMLPEPVTISSTADRIDTGIKLWESDIDFTVATKARRTQSGTEQVLFVCGNITAPWNGLIFNFGHSFGCYVNVTGGNAYTDPTMILKYPKDYIGDVAIVCTHVSGTDLYKIKYVYDGEVYEDSQTKTYRSHSIEAFGGSNYEKNNKFWRNGVISDLRILNRVMTDEEINAYFGVNTDETTEQNE